MSILDGQEMEKEEKRECNACSLSSKINDIIDALPDHCREGGRKIFNELWGRLECAETELAMMGLRPPAASPWIKVSERLPEKNGWYLWKEPDKNHGYVMKSLYWMCEYENRTWVKIQGFTHWSEINPPAEENLKYRAEKSEVEQ